MEEKDHALFMIIPLLFKHLATFVSFHQNNSGFNNYLAFGMKFIGMILMGVSALLLAKHERKIESQKVYCKDTEC